MELRYSAVGADRYCCLFLRLRRKRKASEIRAMRATTPPATPPPIAAPWWLDEDAGTVVGEAVCIIMFVVVRRPPLAADVTTMEVTVTRLAED